MFGGHFMPKKPKKPISDGLLSIDATAETAKLDHLEMLKIALRAKHQADPRDAVSVKEAIKLLDMSRARFNELLAAGLFGSFLDGRSRKIIVHSIYMYLIRLIDLEIEKLLAEMDRRGIGGAEEWLNPTRKA
jgi:predicted HTH domain antitoxin